MTTTNHILFSKLTASCSTLTILKQDSGLLPPPNEDWNTFEPLEGMLAWVDENESFYEFKNSEWIKITEVRVAELELNPEAITMPLI